MSEAQPADGATAVYNPATQDAVGADSGLKSAAALPSGDAPVQATDVDTDSVVSKVESADPTTPDSHMAGDKAEPEPQNNSELTSSVSDKPAAKATPESAPDTTTASPAKPSVEATPAAPTSAEKVTASEVKPDSSNPEPDPAPAAPAAPDAAAAPDVAAAPAAADAAPSAPADAAPAPAAADPVAPAPAPAAAAPDAPAAPAAPAPAAARSDPGQDDSGCDTEPEPEGGPSAPASMAERSGPEMADVEQLARSVVTDTLQKAKQEASMQRQLDNRRQDPDTDEDGWLDIVGNGQLKKKVLTAGRGDRSDRPQRSQLATVHISARLEDGRPATGLPERLTFGLGDGEVVTGLDMAVGLMQPGETAEVYMDARFAYGEKGLDDIVPPDANLTFTVQLENVQPEPQYEDMSAEERLQIGSQKRDRGNWWFKRDDYNHAIQCYRRALDFFDNESDEFTGLPDDVHVLFEERLKVHNNMAAAQMKLEAYDAALRSVQLVLNCQPNNVKALFRKGKILMAQSQVSDAVEALRLALKHSPDNRTVQAELNKVLGVQRKQAEEQKSMYRKMLGLPPAEDRPTPAGGTTKQAFPVKLLAVGVFCALAAIAINRLKLF